MPKKASSSSSSDSSEEEDLSKFASCAVSADVLRDNAVKERQQRQEEAVKRAKARGGGNAGDSDKGGPCSEHESLDPVSLKIAQALSQRIEAAYKPGKQDQKIIESGKKVDVPEVPMEVPAAEEGVRLFRRVKKGSALIIPEPLPVVTQEKIRGVTAQERVLGGTRYKHPAEDESDAVISILGAEGETMKVHEDESIKERKKKRRMEAEKQRSIAAAAKEEGVEKLVKKKKKAKVEGVVLVGRPLVDQTSRMKVLIGS